MIQLFFVKDCDNEQLDIDNDDEFIVLNKIFYIYKINEQN